MYAPDVVRGNDGRYYLYYDLSGRGSHDFDGPISVAVCDTPAGNMSTTVMSVILTDVPFKDLSSSTPQCSTTTAESI